MHAVVHVQQDVLKSDSSFDAAKNEVLSLMMRRSHAGLNPPRSFLSSALVKYSPDTVIFQPVMSSLLT